MIELTYQVEDELAVARKAAWDYFITAEQKHLATILESRGKASALIDQIPALVGTHLQPEEGK